MSFLAELEWRNMLHQMTPGLEDALAEGMLTGYIGFDPTAPSLTIGNYVQIMILKHFQNAGHQPIVLMGGATGRIGDPSGKDKERQLKSFDELDENLSKQMKQFTKFLNFEEGANKALFVNNLDVYKDMSAIDFLRNVGKTLTVNYMMSKESVKKRIETGISFTEFSYQLLQGYDFQYLYQNHNCRLQMGGSDQWGNITTGTEFVKRNVEDGKAFAVTTPLLTKADGTKFGKSEKGNIWLDPEMTSPYTFYQFWIDCSDADLPNFLRYFSLKSRAEIESLEAENEGNPNAIKRALAEELTVRVHSEEAYKSAKKVSDLLFKKVNAETLQDLEVADFKMVSKEVPSYEVSKDQLVDDLTITSLLTSNDILPSNGAVRKAVQNNAISINSEKVKDFNHAITRDLFIHNRFLLVENGKKSKILFELI